MIVERRYKMDTDMFGKVKLFQSADCNQLSRPQSFFNLQMWHCFGDGLCLEGSDVLGMTDISWLQLSLICFVWCEGHTKIGDQANLFFLEKNLSNLEKAMYDELFLLNLDL